VSLILSALTIYGGHIVADAPINEHVIVGGGFVILSLAVVNAITPGLADVFALLLFIVVFLKYGLEILVAIGIAAGGSNGTT
jgi:ABC-type multidrug transport system permease subunit